MILTAATRNESGSSKTSGGNIMHETLTVWAPRALSVLRIYTGLLLLAHGTAKILGFPAGRSFANVEINSLTGARGLIELIGAALSTMALFTPPCPFTLSS